MADLPALKPTFDCVINRAVREIPWRSRYELLKERIKPRYMNECVGTPRRGYQENVINGIRVQPTFNPYVHLNKERRYRLDHWPSRNWDDWNPLHCYARGGRRRFALPESILPLKDELGDAHPPRLSGRYKGDIEKQYYMNGLAWVWEQGFYDKKLHHRDRDVLEPKTWYRLAYRQQRMELELKNLDKHLEQYRQENRLRRRLSWFDKAIVGIAGEELANKYVRVRKVPKIA